MSETTSGGGSIYKATLDDSRSRNLAQFLHTARRHRAEVLGPDLARELSWDILLVLYLHDQRARVNVSALQVDVHSSMTTVLRWIQKLEDEGLIRRHPHPTDGRISSLELSDVGKQTLDRYFDEMAILENTAL